VFTDGPAVVLDALPARPPMAWAWLRSLNANATARRVDEERLRAALERLRRLDPGLSWDEDAGGVLLAGVSSAEVQLAVERLRAELGEAISVGRPPVRYRERLVGSAAEVHGLHRKTDGDDVLELGECWLDVRPTALEKGFVYEVTVDDDVLPRKFWSAVGEGARRALARGPLADCPVIGVHVTCVNGEYDALESIDAHFELAGDLAMRAALERCGTELMEPWSDVVIHLPSGLVGALLSEIPSHRGRVLGLEVDDEESQVHAWLPDVEVLGLGGRLEALASGRAWFVSAPSHYERLPVELVPEVLKQTRAARTGGGGGG
jgi:elongation factor G